MTALAEGTRDGGTRWTSVYAIFPNVTVMGKATIAAGVISHSNGGFERLEGMEVVTSTRRKGERRPLIVFKSRKGFPFMEQPLATNLRVLYISLEEHVFWRGLLI
jgi:hypothetical protein